jgi:hypothetical protein
MVASNSFRLIRARQSALGTYPVAGFRRAWVADYGVKPDETFEQPATITGDSLIGKPLNLKTAVGGPVRGEFAFKQIDWMYEMAFLAAYQLTPEADGANIPSVTAVTDLFTTDNGATFTAGDLVEASGFTNAANNGTFVAIAGSGQNALKIGAGGTLADETPPAGARLKVIGVEGASGDITATALGLGSTAMDWSARPWIKAGMQCKIGGAAGGAAGLRFATVADNRFASVVAKTATALSLVDLGGSWAVDAGAGKTIRVYFGDFLNRGLIATAPFETHEMAYLEQGAPVHMRYSDLAGNTFQQNLQRNSRIEATLGIVGFQDFFGSAETDAPDTDVFVPPMLTGDNLGEILINNAARASHSVVKAANYDLNNNLLTDGALNQKRDSIYAPGDTILRVGITAKFGSDIDWSAFRAGTPMSILMPFFDGLGHAYARKLWTGVYVDGDASPGGRNQFVDFEGTIQGYKDPTYGFMETMTRFEGIGI